jgi:hypothetical protein
VVIFEGVLILRVFFRRTVRVGSNLAKIEKKKAKLKILRFQLVVDKK